jgi:hypothetical protein
MAQARNQYKPADIRMNETLSVIGLQQNWRGNVGLDFTQFDTTVAAAGGLTHRWVCVRVTVLGLWGLKGFVVPELILSGFGG